VSEPAALECPLTGVLVWSGVWLCSGELSGRCETRANFCLEGKHLCLEMESNTSYCRNRGCIIKGWLRSGSKA